MFDVSFIIVFKLRSNILYFHTMCLYYMICTIFPKFFFCHSSSNIIAFNSLLLLCHDTLMATYFNCWWSCVYIYSLSKFLKELNSNKFRLNISRTSSLGRRIHLLEIASIHYQNKKLNTKLVEP
jgi:hypothetical protein